MEKKVESFLYKDSPLALILRTVLSNISDLNKKYANEGKSKNGGSPEYQRKKAQLDAIAKLLGQLNESILPIFDNKQYVGPLDLPSIYSFYSNIKDILQPFTSRKKQFLIDFEVVLPEILKEAIELSKTNASQLFSECIIKAIDQHQKEITEKAGQVLDKEFSIEFLLQQLKMSIRQVDMPYSLSDASDDFSVEVLKDDIQSSVYNNFFHKFNSSRQKIDYQIEALDLSSIKAQKRDDKIVLDLTTLLNTLLRDLSNFIEHELHVGFTHPMTLEFLVSLLNLLQEQLPNNLQELIPFFNPDALYYVPKGPKHVRDFVYLIEDEDEDKEIEFDRGQYYQNLKKSIDNSKLFDHLILFAVRAYFTSDNNNPKQFSENEKKLLASIYENKFIAMAEQDRIYQLQTLVTQESEKICKLVAEKNIVHKQMNIPEDLQGMLKIKAFDTAIQYSKNLLKNNDDLLNTLKYKQHEYTVRYCDFYLTNNHDPYYSSVKIPNQVVGRSSNSSPIEIIPVQAALDSLIEKQSKLVQERCNLLKEKELDLQVRRQLAIEKWQNESLQEHTRVLQNKISDLQNRLNTSQSLSVSELNQLHSEFNHWTKEFIVALQDTCVKAKPYDLNNKLLHQLKKLSQSKLIDSMKGQIDQAINTARIKESLSQDNLVEMDKLLQSNQINLNEVNAESLQLQQDMRQIKEKIKRQDDQLIELEQQKATYEEQILALKTASDDITKLHFKLTQEQVGLFQNSQEESQCLSNLQEIHELLLKSINVQKIPFAKIDTIIDFNRVLQLIGLKERLNDFTEYRSRQDDFWRIKPEEAEWKQIVSVLSEKLYSTIQAWETKKKSLNQFETQIQTNFNQIIKLNEELKLISTQKIQIENSNNQLHTSYDERQEMETQSNRKKEELQTNIASMESRMALIQEIKQHAEAVINFGKSPDKFLNSIETILRLKQAQSDWEIKVGAQKGIKESLEQSKIAIDLGIQIKFEAENLEDLSTESQKQYNSLNQLKEMKWDEFKDVLSQYDSLFQEVKRSETFLNPYQDATIQIADAICCNKINTLLQSHEQLSGEVKTLGLNFYQDMLNNLLQQEQEAKAFLNLTHVEWSKPNILESMNTELKNKSNLLQEESFTKFISILNQTNSQEDKSVALTNAFSSIQKQLKCNQRIIENSKKMSYLYNKINDIRGFAESLDDPETTRIALQLAQELDSCIERFIKTLPEEQANKPEYYNQFKDSFLSKLHSYDEQMKPYIALWEIILVNIAIAVCTVGLAHAYQLGKSLATNTSFSFFHVKTEWGEQSDTLEENCDSFGSKWVSSSAA